MTRKPRAVVLLSGGLDSTTILALAKRDGFDPYALSFHYGQRHEAELDAAARIAATFEVAKHIVVDIDLRQLGGSALTSDIAVPQSDTVDDIGSGMSVKRCHNPPALKPRVQKIDAVRPVKRTHPG